MSNNFIDHDLGGSNGLGVAGATTSSGSGPDHMRVIVASKSRSKESNVACNDRASRKCSSDMTTRCGKSFAHSATDKPSMVQ